MFVYICYSNTAKMAHHCATFVIVLPLKSFKLENKTISNLNGLHVSEEFLLQYKLTGSACP